MRTSSETDKISEAFALAQGEFKPVEKNKINPHFNSPFADLSSIISATRAALSSNGLCVSQCPSYVEGRIFVTSTLFHKSGQWISNECSLKPIADTPQALGSAITYARRYALAALLGVNAEDDDDGNEACKPSAKAQAVAARDDFLDQAIAHKQGRL